MIFRFRKCVGSAILFLATCFPSTSFADDLGEHGFAKNREVKIHYVTAGEGPLVVMLHGFPDYWYTWRKQIPAISQDHQIVAIDMRGFNKSDQPEAVEDYEMSKLVSDVKALVDHFGRTEATIIGHDWGGMVAWSFAMQHPEMTQRLIILNLPHPACLTRELANNPTQQAASAYAREFQRPNADSNLTAEGLVSWVQDDSVREKYTVAMKRSSMKGMLSYYKANYPREPYTEQKDFPQVLCPVLMIHGLNDKALLADGLNGTWKHIDNTLTLVTVPDAGHFVQQDAADLVTNCITRWLSNQSPSATPTNARTSE